MKQESPISAAPAVERPGTALQRRPWTLHRRLNFLLALAFFGALIVPLVGTFAGWDLVGHDSEKRALAAFPGKPQTFRDFNRYTDRASAWFTDHFGFRNTLIHAIKTIQLQTVGISNSSKVIVGTEGWLFLRRMPDTGPPDLSFTLERGQMPFSREELERWRLLLEKRHAYLEARGIPFLVAVVPDKQAIYPEYLPESLRGPTPAVARTGRLDQLLDYLQEMHSPLAVADLRRDLLARKAEGGGEGQLFFKTDTHWSAAGAYVGYVRILAEISQRLPGRSLVPLSKRELIHGDLGMRAGDLSELLNLGDQLREPWLVLNSSLPFTYKEVTGGPAPTLQAVGDDKGQPRLLMYRDSFATALFPLLAPHFSDSLFVWDDAMDAGEIEGAKPDIVVNEFVERKLYWKMPVDSAEISAMTLPARRAAESTIGPGRVP